MLTPNDDTYFSKPMREGTDYYNSPQGYRVFTEKYHIERGYCCGNGCRHCPYFPEHIKGTMSLKE